MTEKKVEDHVIMLVDVRLAFASVFQMSSVKPGDKPAFSGTFLFPPAHPAIQVVQTAIQTVAIAKWGDQATEILTTLIAGQKVCLHNGNEKAQYDGFAGNMFVASRSPTRPLILDADKSVLVEENGRPYSGCYVNAQLAIWAQANSYGKRVNAQLRGVQFLRDGDAFGGGGVSTPDEFEAVTGTDADAPAPGDAVSVAAAWGAA